MKRIKKIFFSSLLFTPLALISGTQNTIFNKEINNINTKTIVADKNVDSDNYKIFVENRIDFFFEKNNFDVDGDCILTIDYDKTKVNNAQVAISYIIENGENYVE